MKFQTINFRDFIANDYKIKKRKLPVYSFGLFSTTALLNPPPLIAKAYFLMIGIGLFLIVVAALEKYLAFNSQVEIAKSIVGTLQALMPYALIGALIAFVYLNPLL